MQTREHVHEETFAVPPEDLFRLLHTPSSIRAWWGASRVIVLPADDGVWAAVWGESEDDPDYITVARIEAFDPPHRMRLTDYRYASRSGPLPFEADIAVEFTVDRQPAGASLRVVQSGFPMDARADAFYEACETGWHETFAGIRRFVQQHDSQQDE